MTAKDYQVRLVRLLAAVFGDKRAFSERSVRTNAADFFRESAIYAPRPDIAVGPFNLTEDSVDQDVRLIRAASQHRLIQEIRIIAQHQNDGRFFDHGNPRCLLAIEIEFSGSSKHILGDFANASMLGLIGAVIASPKNIAKIERVAQYVKQLRNVKKAPPTLFSNVACFNAKDFLQLLQKHIAR